jgi:hypothetical protein
MVMVLVVEMKLDKGRWRLLVIVPFFFILLSFNLLHVYFVTG